jgi:hypothetical protein
MNKPSSTTKSTTKLKLKKNLSFSNNIDARFKMIFRNSINKVFNLIRNNNNNNNN